MKWKSIRTRDSNADPVRRRLSPELLEARQLLAADPIHVGVVYLETDYLESDQDVGSDSRGDRFIVSFSGGAPNSELTKLRIITDKDGDGISVGDPIYDTSFGGRGKSGAHDFQIFRVHTADGRAVDAVAEVSDGGQELVLRLSNFRAGDRLEFTLDVDEVLRNAVDLEVFNDRLDVITSGQEFQDVILEATFDAPHYQTAHADSIFLNDYGDPNQTHGLNLPPDEGDDIDSRPDRSAAAVATSQQVPKPISLSGHVWIDNDLDLLRESDEPTLHGIELSLWQRDEDTGRYVDTGLRALTDDFGRYEFPKSLELKPGVYQVVQTQIAGFFSVGANPGTIDGQIVGRAQGPNVLTNIVIPLGGQVVINNDFAEAQPASIRGYVYGDDDDDAVRDENENGIAGVTVRLVPIQTLAPQSELTVTTAADGSYSFMGLSPGQYEVIEVDQPASFSDGRDSAGTVDGIVVGVADQPGDRIRQIRLDGNDHGIEYNFGELALGELSGFVYLAAPGEDCTERHDDPGNIPLAGVRVELHTASGIVVTQTTTALDGSYQFDDVPKGTYRILQFTPDHLIDGEAHVGNIDGVQVGEATGGGTIQAITLNPGGIGTNYNFCEMAPATISGYVYHDRSSDGDREPGEEGIAGTVVSLVDAEGRIVATAITDENGRYEFTGILPGEYSLIESQPEGYFDGLDTPGLIDGNRVGIPGSDGDSITAITIKQGQTGEEFNFGELLGATLSGLVHADTDGDCVLDPGEDTLAGVTIRLIDAAGNEVATTVTDANGRYTFTNIKPGEYSIVEEQPAGLFEGDAIVGSAGGVAENPSRIGQVTLGSGEVAVDYNFCEHPAAEIIGSVFSDTNGDCIFDAHEIGIDGVLVELFNDLNELVASTRTDAAGNYHFSNLPAGHYTIRETQPAGWLQGGQRAGSAGGDDSVADVISLIPVGWGERLTQYNFCEIAPSSISGFVHADRDGDCVFDPDEEPIAGVTIDLRDADGNVIAQTITDENGQYSFDNLPPAEYQVFEHQPEGYLHGGQVPGDRGEVLGVDLLGIDLLAGTVINDFNFCEVEPSSISGFVHVDDDQDCIFDETEQPIAGVAIELRDADGNLVAQTFTDENGRYSFENLYPGDYQVFEHQPDGFFQGGQVPGDGGEVLGIDLLGVELLAGTDANGFNFCELEPASLAGSVWQEADLNRRFDPGDMPLAGVLVELIDQSGDVLEQIRTDAAGHYRFENLQPGLYSLRESQPDGLFHGGQLVGSAGGQVDSDDYLVGIELGSGVDATDYDFPEVPPALLSGIVFQDGQPLILSTQPAAKDLRLYRDGQLTADDTPLSGVVVELRNVLGQPFLGQNAMAGTYPDGPIRTTTDSQGFYQFVGLRPGTYHVYEVQPEGYADSLDSPGTTGGLAVNPADEVDEPGAIMIQTLSQNSATNPNDDAILNVLLIGGTESRFNNFSEILIQSPPEPPVEPPTEEPPVQPPVAPQNPVRKVIAAPIDAFDTQIRISTFAAADGPRDPVFEIDEWAVSWHLSVINGGFPRGIVAVNDAITTVGNKQLDLDWTENDYTRGKWRLMTGKGEVSQSSQSMNLGVEDGTAMAGDFDGDGVDEVVIYSGGTWFVDLNGNGRWDSGDLWIRLGTELDRPVVGDWDGDGKDDVGIFGRQWLRDPQRIVHDPGLPDPDNTRRRKVENRNLVARREDQGSDRKRLLRRGDQGQLRADAVDHVFQYGEHVDTPLSGDWNGDGIDQIGVFRSGQFLLDADGDGRWTDKDMKKDFGRLGDQPVVGDFNGDGTDEIGVIRGDVWIIDTDHDGRLTGNDKQIKVPRENNDSQPVVGDWDGDGKDDPGYYDEAA